jgi:xylulokinase
MSALSGGVDIGSTNVKVTLVDEHGHAVWTKAVPTPRLPDDGGVATDALGLVAMIEEMIALTDYPAVAWTGRAFMSETLAARTACYDVYERCWIEPLLTAVGAPRLPPVVPAGTVLGSVRKGPLCESGAASTATIVTAGGHDHPVAGATIRRLHPDALVDWLGTANLVYGETIEAAEPRLDPYLAFSVPPMGNAGLSCLGVFELAAAIQPPRWPTDLVQRLLASDRVPGIPRDRPIPIPANCSCSPTTNRPTGM